MQFLGIDSETLIILCGLVFAAGFVDSVAGGGGCLSLPAYLLTGLPTRTAFACNKLSSACGTTFAAAVFFKGGAVELKSAAIASLAAFAGAAAASRLVLSISPLLFQKILVLTLPFAAVFLLLKKDFGKENTSAEISGTELYSLSALAGLLLGFYDGFVGPGTGTFAIMAFSALLKFDLKTASGNAKILNLASNYASAISFMAAGLIIYRLALLTAAFNIAGNLLGSRLAIKKGAPFIRIMMSVAITILLIKLASEAFELFY